MDNIREMHEWCEILNEELAKRKNDARNGGIKSMGDLEEIDKLTHALKSVKTIMAMEEGGYSHADRGGSYGYNPNTYYERGYYDGGNSYRRGRDSMGRYSSEGENLAQKIKGMIGEAPTPQIRMELERLAQQINNAM